MWECLLGFNFRRSQHKINLGSVLGSILGGFGLHLERFWGSKKRKLGVQERSKDDVEKEDEKRAKKQSFPAGSAEWREPVGEHFARTKWTSHALLPLEASSKTGAADIA